MIKPFFLVFLIGLLAPIFIFGDSKVPLWMTDIDAVYSQDTYLAAVGTGDTRRDAESDAASALAQIFKVHIKTDSTATMRYHDLVADSKSFTEKERTFVENVQSSTDGQFMNLKYSDPYTDKTGRVNIVAYLEKDSTVQVYRAVLDKNIKLIDQLKARSLKAPTRLIRFALLDSAVQISAGSDLMIAQLQIIKPAAAKLAENDFKTQELAAQRDTAALNLGYKISLTGDSEGKVAALIRGSLANLKINANEKGALIVQGTVSMEPVDNPKYKTVRWSLDIKLTDETGSQVANYFKESRENGLTQKDAEAYAIKEMGKKINSDFIKALNDYLTRASSTQ